MVRIKIKKQMRLDEMIKAVRNGEAEPAYYESEEDSNVYVGFDVEDKSFHSGVTIPLEHTFTISTEEDLTKDTEFDKLHKVYYNPFEDCVFTKVLENTTIRNITENIAVMPNSAKLWPLAVYYKDTLIWSKEHGIPTEGVIEV